MTPITSRAHQSPPAVEERTGDPSRSGRQSIASSVVDIPAVFLTLLMMVHVVAQALGRKSGRTIPDTLEIVEFWYMPLIAMLGFVSAHIRRENVVTDLLMAHLRPINVQRLLETIFGIASCVLCLGFAYFGWIEALRAQDIDMTAGTSGLAVWPIYFAVPATFVILALLYGRDAVARAGRSDETSER